MFDDLRAAFREAIENFNKELRHDQVPETVDRLLVQMRNEIADEKAAAARLEEEVGKARAEAQREKDQGETARRRERMAGKIGDEETAGVAARYAAKHEGHHQVIERKIAALEEELAFRRGTVEEMFQRYSEAKEKRDVLAAATGRSSARDSLAEADDLFSELDRMAERIEGERARGEAAEAFDGLDLEFDEQLDLDAEQDAPRREELNVDAALAELKRRMGKQ
jgi:phage shock protein A